VWLSAVGRDCLGDLLLLVAAGVHHADLGSGSET
jgi:hypothetical protein